MKEVKNLILILRDKKKMVSLKEICIKMNVSNGKAKSIIKEARSQLPENIAQIISKVGNGNGYSLFVYDDNELDSWLKKSSDKRNGFEEKEIRVFILLEKLLNNNRIKSEELMEELFVSRAQLTKDLKIVRSLLEKYDLKISSTPHYGLSIEGDEFKRRLCMTNYLQKDVHFDWNQVPFLSKILPDKTTEELREILYKNLNKYDYNISECAFNSLVIHLMVMLMRVMRDHDVSIDRKIIDFEDMELFELSKAILNNIEEKYNVAFGVDEQLYFTMQLTGKRYIKEEGNIVISDEIFGLVNKMLDELKRNYQMDLYDDFNLRIQLALHLIPLLKRVKYRINMNNPLLEDIKSKFAYEFDLALSCCNVINNLYKCNISEDEASYIAIYLGMAINNHDLACKNILLVCQSGKVGSTILKRQLLDRFPKYINKIETCMSIEIATKDLSNYDYVFSTVPITERIEIPIINIQCFLEDIDYKDIKSILTKKYFDFDKYFNERLFIKRLKGTTKEEIIIEMIQKINKYITLPSNFYDLIMKRENFAATDFGDKVALPHPSNPIDIKSFICMGILPKPVLWKKKKVQVVMLIVLQKNSSDSNQNFYKAITKFASQRELIDELVDNPSFEKLREIFEGMEM